MNKCAISKILKLLPNKFAPLGNKICSVLYSDVYILLRTSLLSVYPAISIKKCYIVMQCPPALYKHTYTYLCGLLAREGHFLNGHHFALFITGLPQRIVNLLHYKHALYLTYIIHCSETAMSNLSLVGKYRIWVVLWENIGPFRVLSHVLQGCRFYRHTLSRTASYSISKLPRPSTDNKYSTNIITLVSW